MDKSQEIKMLIIDPVPRDVPADYYQWKMNEMNKVARPGTILEYTCIRKGLYNNPTTPYERMVNGEGIVEQAYIAERKSYDAVIVGGVCDFRNEVRSMVDIPVHFPSESAFLMAMMLGNKFSVIVDSPHWLYKFEDQFTRWGIKDRVASLRLPVNLKKMNTWDWVHEENQDEFTKIISEEMKKAVEEDQAEALIMGFTVGSTVLSMKGVREIEGAYVIDTMISAMKMGEMMVDMQRYCGFKVCHHSIYERPYPGWDKVRPIIIPD